PRARARRPSARAAASAGAGPATVLAARLRCRPTAASGGPPPTSASAAASAGAEDDLSNMSRGPEKPELRAHGVVDPPLRAVVSRRGIAAQVRPAAAALCAARARV